MNIEEALYLLIYEKRLRELGILHKEISFCPNWTNYKFYIKLIDIINQLENGIKKIKEEDENEI
jgi:hypothetical protein